MNRAAIAIILLGRHLGYAPTELSGGDTNDAGNYILTVEGFEPSDGIELSPGNLEFDLESGVLITLNEEGDILSTVDAVALCSRLPLVDGSLTYGADPDPRINENADQAAVNQKLDVAQDDSGVRDSAADYADADLSQGQTHNDDDSRQ